MYLYYIFCWRSIRKRHSKNIIYEQTIRYGYVVRNSVAGGGGGRNDALWLNSCPWWSGRSVRILWIHTVQGILTEKALRKTRHWMMPSMVSPARQKVPVRWRPLRPTAEAVTQAPGGALSKRSRESIAKHTSSPHHHGHCGLRMRGHFSRTSLSHCYVCLLHVCYLHKPLPGVNNNNTMLSNISFLTSCLFNQFLNHLKYDSLLKKLSE